MSDKENLSPDDAVSVIEMAGVFVVNTAHEGYRRAGFVLHSGENTLPPVSVSVLEALEADPRLVVTVIAADTDSDTPGRLDNQSTFTAIEQELEQQRLADEKHHQEAEAAEQARQAEEQARQVEELARQEAEAAEQAHLAEEQARRDADATKQPPAAPEKPVGKGRGAK